jgi:hypothetical protein
MELGPFHWMIFVVDFILHHLSVNLKYLFHDLTVDARQIKKQFLYNPQDVAVKDRLSLFCY